MTDQKKDRASFSLDDDLSSFTTKPISNNNVDQKAVEKAAKDQGFISRTAVTKKSKRRTPYTEQNNFKSREGMKDLFLEFCEEEGVFWQEGLEQAMCMLIQKKGSKELAKRINGYVQENGISLEE